MKVLERSIDEVRSRPSATARTRTVLAQMVMPVVAQLNDLEPRVKINIEFCKDVCVPVFKPLVG